MSKYSTNSVLSIKMVQTLLVGFVLAGILIGCGGRKIETSDPVSMSDNNSNKMEVNPKNGNNNPKPIIKEEPFKWRGGVKAGPAVLIKLKNPIGMPIIYTCRNSRLEKGKGSLKESSSFFLTSNALKYDKSEGLFYLFMVKTYTDRLKKEIMENGKKQEHLLPNIRALVNLGPNSEMVAGRMCYPFDAQNRIAFRANNAGQPMPYVLTKHSMHFLFPFLSKRILQPGQTWKYKSVNVLIPIRQGLPGAVYPTQFPVQLTCGLRQVIEKNGKRTAVIDYHAKGVFDSKDDKFKGRFPDEFHLNQSMHIRHTLSGVGTVLIDLDKGRIIKKEEGYILKLFVSGLKPKADGKGYIKDRNYVEVTSKFNLHLTPPGTRLPGGQVVQSQP